MKKPSAGSDMKGFSGYARAVGMSCFSGAVLSMLILFICALVMSARDIPQAGRRLYLRPADPEQGLAFWISLRHGIVCFCAAVQAYADRRGIFRAYPL